MEYNNIEMKLVGLSYGQTSNVGSFILVLSEMDGNRKIPIVIKSTEALNIEIKLQEFKSKRPDTYDFIKKLINEFNVEVKQVDIVNVLEGIFYAKIVFLNTIDDFEIECNITDAIVMSIIYKCPIFCNSTILKMFGITLNENNEVINEPYDEIKPNIESLQKMLQKSLDVEDYDTAAQLRDKIEELKNIK